MFNKSKDLGLILAIIFASTVISGSLVFFGLQFAPKSQGFKVEDFEQALDNYVQKQQQKQQQLQQQQLQQQIDSQPTGSANQQTEKTAILASKVKKVSPADHIRGNAKANISLIEYSDFECPFCKSFHPTTNQILAAYGDKVNIVYRHWPLPFHEPMASKEAVASECANELGGNDKFWGMVDLMFENTTSNGNGLSEKDLLQFSSQLGLDQGQFKSCLDSGKYDKKIKSDLADGEKAGVSGTPGNILINNKTGEAYMLDGARPFVSFQMVIDDMLKK